MWYDGYRDKTALFTTITHPRVYWHSRRTRLHSTLYSPSMESILWVRATTLEQTCPSQREIKLNTKDHNGQWTSHKSLTLHSNIMSQEHSLLYSHLIGDTSTPSQSKRFYDEVCRYFEEEEEGKRDLYEEIELLFSRRRRTLRTSNQTTRP